MCARAPTKNPHMSTTPTHPPTAHLYNTSIDVYPLAGRGIDFNSKRVAPHEPVLLADGALLLRSQLGDLCIVAKDFLPSLRICLRSWSLLLTIAEAREVYEGLPQRRHVELLCVGAGLLFTLQLGRSVHCCQQ